MNRLQSELQRLYKARPDAEVASSQVDQAKTVRSMVLELARPPDWELLSKVWRGVQADLELPAPGIAVSGTDGFQLWFSLEHPVTVHQASAFVQSLCSRYLPEVALARLRLMPAPSTATVQPVLQAPPVPALQHSSGYWSAFVSPDLAPIFADTPWLDSAPSDDGQAGVLRPLLSITQPEFDAALERLGLATLQPDASDSASPIAPAELPPAPPSPTPDCRDPKHFLLQVMNDDSVALALRVEAAKALLPYYVEKEI